MYVVFLIYIYIYFNHLRSLFSLLFVCVGNTTECALLVYIFSYVTMLSHVLLNYPITLVGFQLL